MVDRLGVGLVLDWRLDWREVGGSGRPSHTDRRFSVLYTSQHMYIRTPLGLAISSIEALGDAVL